MVLNPSTTVAEQVEAACRYVQGAIRAGRDMKLGRGSGPINHFHSENTEAAVKVEIRDVAADPKR